MAASIRSSGFGTSSASSHVSGAVLLRGLSDKQIVAQLKLKGLSAVTAEAVASIQRVLAREREPDAALSALAKSLRATLHSRSAGGAGAVVDQRLVEDVVAESTRNEDDTRQDAFSVVSAFELPRYTYDAARKAYFWFVLPPVSILLPFRCGL